MRRALLSLALVFLLAPPALAGQGMMPGPGVMEYAAGGGPTSPDLYIEFEQAWTSGSAYTPGGNDISPDTSLDSSVDFQRSGAYFSSGSYSALNPTADKGAFQSAITDNNIFNSGTGFVQVVVWANATNTNGLFEARKDSANYVYLSLQDTNVVLLRRRANDVNKDSLSTSQCGNMTACMIQARWKQSVPTMSVRVCSDGTCDTESWEGVQTDSQSGFTTGEPTTLVLGASNLSVTSDYYMDNFSLWNNYEKD